jgi:hypothetical protein
MSSLRKIPQLRADHDQFHGKSPIVQGSDRDAGTTISSRNSTPESAFGLHDGLAGRSLADGVMAVARDFDFVA